MKDDARITSIFEDWYEKHDRGEAPTPEDVIQAHPDIAESLRARFAGLGVLDQVYQLPSDLPEGTPEEIGDYRIIREIGRGGMGVVYEAEQKSMQRRVALKLLSLAVTSTAQAVKRFQREARAGGKFHHTNVVPIYGMGQHAGHWYYAMELVEGSPLNTVLDDVRQSEQGKPVESPSDPTSFLGTDSSDPGYFLRVAGMFAGVADALDHAHQAGVIHRDIKPSNLLLEADGTLKLVDFGLAYISDTGLPSMTMTGDLIGTPVYMSPEQATAKKIRVDHRTDVYSLGATLYEVLSLVPPFQANSLPDLCNQILNRDPQPPSRKNPRIPRDLETIVQKAMDKDREKRYPTAGALARDLQRFALGDPIRARRIGPIARSWRKIKRHRVRSALVATSLVLAAVVALFAVRAAEESKRRRSLEYDRLLRQAEDVMTAAHGFTSTEKGASTRSPAVRANLLLTAAIQLVPGRSEAFWLRSQAEGRTPEQRWRDLSEAGSQGLPARTLHFTRSHLLEHEGRLEEAARERRLAEREPATPESAYFEGVMLARGGHRKTALGKFDEALRGARSSRHLTFLVHRQRARTHEELGDFGSAMHDLKSLQELGYDRLSVQIRLASLERRMGRSDVADEKFDEVLVGIREAGNAATWHQLCIQCRASEEPTWREIATAEAIAEHPADSDIARERVTWLMDAERLDDALALALEALERDAGTHTLQGELARVHLASGDLEKARAAFEMSLETRGGCYHCLVGYGRTLYRLGELDPAIATWKRAIQANPLHPVGYYNLALDYAENGQLDEAEEAYRDAIRMDASYAGAYCNLATLLLEDRHNAKEALLLIDRAIDLEPEEATYHVNRSNMLLAMNEVDEAEKALLQALELDDDLGEAMNNLGAIELNNRGDYEAALAWFLKAAELQPDSVDAVYNVGLTYSKMFRYREALPYLKKVLELDDGPAVYHSALGAALFYGARDVQGSKVELDLAIELDDTRADDFLVRGIVYADGMDQYEEALADFRKAVELNPNQKIAQRNAGFALMKLHRPQKAIAEYDKALELDDEDALTHLWRALCIQDVEGPEEALVALDAGLALVPEDPVLLNNKGVLLNDALDRHADALEVFAQVAALDPNDWRYVSNQGHALVGLGRMVDAAEAFLAAEKLRPKDPHLPHRHAEVLLSHGQYTLARRGYERAIEMAPKWNSPRFGMIHLLYETGKWEEGLEVTREAHEMWPDDGFVRYMLLAYLRATDGADEAKLLAEPWSDGEAPEGYYALMHAYFCAVAGKPEAARVAISNKSDPDAESLYSVAAIHALLGDDDATVDCLERSLEGGYRRHKGSVHDPDFDESDDPRIPELLKRFEAE